MRSYAKVQLDYETIIGSFVVESLFSLYPYNSVPLMGHMHCINSVLRSVGQASGSPESLHQCVKVLLKGQVSFVVERHTHV